MFYVVESYADGSWQVYPMLYDRGSALLTAAAVKDPPRRVRKVDLVTGWSHRDAEGLVGEERVHVTGARIRRSMDGLYWRVQQAERFDWDDGRRGEWHARWAALGFAVEGEPL